MNLNELDQYLELVNSVLLKSAVKINKWREKFMVEVLLLYLIIPRRINFLQLDRYGRYGEQRYRQQFGRRFDWLSFNAGLVDSHTGNRGSYCIRAELYQQIGQTHTLHWPFLVGLCQDGQTGFGNLRYWSH